MPTDFRATTSSPAFGRAVLPSTQVAQYVNQQIVRNPDRAEAARNAAMPMAEPVTRQSARVATTGGEDQYGSRLTSTANSISNANRRLVGYSEQARKVREARAAAQGTNTGARGATLPGNVMGPDGQVVNGWTLYRSAPNMAGLKGNRLAAVREASSYLGNPYVFAGRSHQGIDCSGLVMEVYNKLGFNVARHSATWQRDNIPGVKTYNLNELRPGDLVAWQDGSHIAIYAGNGEIIEAQNPNVGVVRDKIWSKNVVGIKLRFAGE